MNALTVTGNEDLDSFLNKGREDRIKWIRGRAYYECNPLVVCKDGYSVSVQCQENNYCQPALNLPDVKGYSSFELGFPNREDSLINEFAEGEEYTETVYGYVPRKVVEKLIKKHGGLI